MNKSPTARVVSGIDPPGGHVVGVKEFFRKFFGFRDKQADAAERGVHKATETLALLAEYYTPIDKGDLITSQAVLYEGHGFQTVGHIQYTDPKAATVHEDLSYRHGERYNQHYASEIALGLTHARRPQEKAKFLEDPLRENEMVLREMILAEVRKVRPS